MDSHRSGLVTPPLVSPRPIQTQRPLSADDSWKIVGSPPRRPLLSPPEEREHNPALQDSDITIVEGNRPTPLVGAMSSEHLYLADSTVSSFSADTSNKSLSESSSSSTSSPTSPTAPQYGQGSRHASKDLAASLDGLSTISAIDSGRELSASHFALDLDSDDTIQPLHFKSSSTGTVGSRHLTSLPEHSSLIGSNSFAPPGDLERAVGGRRSSLKQTGGVLESTPLTLSSFIWSGPTASNPTKAPITESSSIGPLVSIGSSSSGVSRADTSGSMSSNRHRSASFLDHLPSHTLGSGLPRTGRSLSFSESSFSSTLDLVSSAAGYDQDDDEVLRFRPGLPIMEEEYEDPLEPRLSRARSFSTSAALNHGTFSSGLSSSVFMGARSQDLFSVGNASSTSIGSSQRSPFNPTLSDGFSAWPTSARPETALSSHRRSNTSTTCYNAPIWETSGPFQHLPAPLDRDRQVDRQRVARRFSVAPSSGFQNYGAFLDDADAGNSSTLSSSNRYPLDNDPMQQQVQRRHSVAGVGGSHFRPSTAPYALTSSFESLHIGEECESSGWGLKEELHDQQDYSVAGSNTKELGKGLSLGQLPHREALYVVEFKAGRNDLFYCTESSGLSLKTGDLVIVEADRGKDLGKITNDSITPKHIQALQDQQAELAAMQAQQDGSASAHRTPKEIHPKRIFRLAQSTEISQLVHKSQDEVKAMMVCQTKVRQKRLPMEVVDAEYQWDRRKLTFYFVAERRIDFRELVRDLFKIYKTRIWMYAVSPSMAQASLGGLQSSTPPPHLPSHAQVPFDNRMELPQQHQQHAHTHQYQSHHHHHGRQQGHRPGQHFGYHPSDPTAGPLGPNHQQGPATMGSMAVGSYQYQQHPHPQHFQPQPSQMYSQY